MKYSITTDNKIQLELVGDIDIVNADQFKNSCITVIDKEKKDVIFDCTNLNFIDSTALGSMVVVNKYADSLGLKIKVVNLKARLKKLFSITALDSIITVE